MAPTSSSFFADRLKVHLRDKGARHDLIDAVFALGGQDDLALIVKRVEALGEFLKTDDGANLLAGVKRAVNILRDEEKKDKKSYAGAYDLDRLTEKEELALAAAIESVKQDTRGRHQRGEFRRRHAGAGRAARAGRCVLRQGDGQCARSGRARQPPRAAVGDPRRDANRGGFLQDCGLEPRAAPSARFVAAGGVIVMPALRVSARAGTQGQGCIAHACGPWVPDRRCAASGMTILPIGRQPLCAGP